MTRTGWSRWENAQLIAQGVLEIGDGYRAKNSELGTEGLPFARAGNIQNGFHLQDADLLQPGSVHLAREKISRPGDIVFTSKGTVGRFAFVKPTTPPFVYSPQLCYWRIKKPPLLDPRYLFYWMQGEDFLRQVHQVKSQTTIADYVSLGDQRRMYILAPPLPIQRTIAGILAAYDDLIENHTRRIANLEERARLLYDEWFVKFRFPGHERVRLVESAVGMVPDGWGVVKLGDVMEFAYGKALKAEDRMPGTIPVYGSSGIVGYHEESLVRGPGIIVGRKGNVGTVYWSESDFYPIDTVFYVQTHLSLPYVCYNLSGQRFLNSDAAVPGLRRQQAYLLDFLKPPDELLKKFEQWARPLFREKFLLERTNITLRQTRDRLLPGLISGEIDVAGWRAGEAPEMASVLARRAVPLRRVAEAAGPVEPVGDEGMAWDSLWE